MTNDIRTATSAGLHVYESGHSGQPLLLFLHGSPLSGRMWLPQLERLTEFHSLAPDLPEHGRSSQVRPFSMGDAVRRLADVVRQAAPDGRAHVIGLSFGGVVAQALMVQQPDLVDHAILTGTSARMSGFLHWIAAPLPGIEPTPPSPPAAGFAGGARALADRDPAIRLAINRGGLEEGRSQFVDSVHPDDVRLDRYADGASFAGAGPGGGERDARRQVDGSATLAHNPRCARRAGAGAGPRLEPAGPRPFRRRRPGVGPRRSAAWRACAFPMRLRWIRLA